MLLRAIFCAVFNIIDDELGTTSVLIPYISQAVGSPTLLCILGSHMFFNLKEAAEHGVNSGTNWSSYSSTGTGTTMNFGGNQVTSNQ